MEITPLDPEHGAPGWKGDARQRLELDPGLLDMRREAFCKIGAYQDVRAQA
jgi:hypothetical protein